MPALTIPSPTHTTTPASPSDDSAHSDRSDRSDRKRSESASPDRPPVSPITPTATAAQLASTEPIEPRPRARVVPPENAKFIRQPPAVSISESENPDAIALRSAISLLQLQKEKSKRDIKALQDLKNAAVSDPQGFLRSMQAQQAQRANSKPDPLRPTLSDFPGAVLSHENGDSEQRSGGERKDSAEVDAATVKHDTTSKFPDIPQPQNIIRCPPVNWAKYHVVGESLDKMHEEQKQYPFQSEPPKTKYGGKAPPHAVASPYSPFVDGVGDAQSRRGSKKPPV